MINSMAVTLAAVCSLALPATTPATTPADSGHAPATTLAEAGARSGREVGVLVNHINVKDSVYSDIVTREFNAVTLESLGDMLSLQPTQGNFNFLFIDQMAGYAAGNKQPVHASRLIVHQTLPAWLSQYRNADALRVVVNKHITTVLTHTRGKVHSWDVVMEAYEDSTGRRRPSLFQRVIGDSYIEEAFIAARAADPKAQLCYGDYYIENINLPKTQAVYGMVKDFKARGIPIDCVSLESHFDTYNTVPDTFQQTIEAFTALGVTVRLSELDVAVAPERQVSEYRKAVGACLAVPGCTSITIYGVRDRDSWRANYTPMLFDNNGMKKPAYYAVLDALNHAPVPVRPKNR